MRIRSTDLLVVTLSHRHQGIPNFEDEITQDHSIRMRYETQASIETYFLLKYR
jgi:hypothetical protein